MGLGASAPSWSAKRPNRHLTSAAVGVALGAVILAGCSSATTRQATSKSGTRPTTIANSAEAVERRQYLSITAPLTAAQNVFEASGGQAAAQYLAYANSLRKTASALSSAHWSASIQALMAQNAASLDALAIDVTALLQLTTYQGFGAGTQPPTSQVIQMEVADQQKLQADTNSHNSIVNEIHSALGLPPS